MSLSFNPAATRLSQKNDSCFASATVSATKRRGALLVVSSAARVAREPRFRLDKKESRAKCIKTSSDHSYSFEREKVNDLVIFVSKSKKMSFLAIKTQL